MKINSNKNQKKIGAFVGKFLPPHVGHLSVIDKALNECDEVVVVISDDAKKSKKLCMKTNFPHFCAKTRLKWFKKHYKNQKNAKFRIIDESKLKSENFDGREYAELFWKSVKEKVNVKYADESYRELNEKYFPECEFVPINREQIPIHSSDIRINLDNLKFVIPEGQADILKAIKNNEN